MDIARLVWSVLAGLVAGFVAYVLLWALGWPTQPWALVVGVLVFLAYLLSGYTFPPRR